MAKNILVNSLVLFCMPAHGYFMLATYNVVFVSVRETAPSFHNGTQYNNVYGVQQTAL